MGARSRSRKRNKERTSKKYEHLKQNAESAHANSQGKLRLDNVYAAPSSLHGWGVFASKPFSIGDLVHRAPVRLLGKGEGDSLPSILNDDLFERLTEPGSPPLHFLTYGFGSLANHSDTPNCRYALKKKAREFKGMAILNFYAIRDVSTNEEITISYGEAYFRGRPWLHKNVTTQDGVRQSTMDACSRSCKRSEERAITNCDNVKQTSKIARTNSWGKLRLDNVYAAPSSLHGWGVFASKPFSIGDLVHRAPVRLLGKGEGDALPSILNEDLIERLTEPGTPPLYFLAYGFGSLANHSDTPNCRYALKKKASEFKGMAVLTFYALKHLSLDEEITISYGEAYFRGRPWLHKNVTTQDGVRQSTMDACSRSCKRSEERAITNCDNVKQTSKIAHTNSWGKLRLDNVYAAPSSLHGWGVFASKPFSIGDLVHRAPVRLLGKGEGDALPSILNDDLFERLTEPGSQPLHFLTYGFGSLANHSDTPNCRYALKKKAREFKGMAILSFYALKDLSLDEEITISYGEAYFRERPWLHKSVTSQDG